MLTITYNSPHDDLQRLDGVGLGWYDPPLRQAKTPRNAYPPNLLVYFSVTNNANEKKKKNLKTRAYFTCFSSEKVGSPKPPPPPATVTVSLIFFARTTCTLNQKTKRGVCGDILRY